LQKAIFLFFFIQLSWEVGLIAKTTTTVTAPRATLARTRATFIILMAFRTISYLEFFQGYAVLMP